MSSTSKVKKSSSSTTKREVKTAPEKTAEGVVYTDSYIEVSKKGGLLYIKNLSGQDLVLDGEATFNHTKEVNMYSFGYIGDVKAGGTKTVNIATIKLMYEGEPGDKKDGETLGEDNTLKHPMKKGEILSWNGEMKDKDDNVLSQVTVEVTY